MSTAFGDLKTARQIAQLTGVPFYRVDYAIQRLGLTEAARVGIVRLYEPAQVDQIQQFLADLSRRRIHICGGSEA
ncbi:MAG: hypothetical protein HZB38_19135 [Planctomycetes bacterium]|nr:hypothetical protein [Planctomycetota bacterium]